MKPIELANVMSVYSGRNGKCCCGCSGTHWYASQYRKIGSKHRGYPVPDKNVSDRNVNRIVNLINQHPENVDVDDSNFRSIVLGNRLYVAYYLPKS